MVLQDALRGAWRSRMNDRSLILSLRADGALLLDKQSGTWRVNSEGKLEMTINGQSDVLSTAFANGQLTLSGAPLAQPMVFSRDPGLGEFMFGWMGIEPSSTWHRVLRVVAIFVWITMARLAIWLTQQVGRAIIMSQRGPLRWIFPQRPLRASTILSLILNTCKYIMYGIGFGFILNTFEVDYTTYLASLSVIGLAIGFGSQGLVQDMVTGIFILLENQFDVGDLVEVSGQIGVVQEMGLRMTRLRTIQGQSVTIPNRSIATVACYGQDGLHADLSIQCKVPEQQTELMNVVNKVVSEFAEQFNAAVLSVDPCRVSTEATADEEAGTHQVIRCDVNMWPGQQALLDQQLLPRLRTALPADLFADSVSTLAWHFDRPPATLNFRKGLSRWLSGERAEQDTTQNT